MAQNPNLDPSQRGNQEPLSQNKSERGSARWAGAFAGGIFGLFVGTAVAIGIREPVALLAVPAGTGIGTVWGYYYGRMVEEFPPQARL